MASRSASGPRAACRSTASFSGLPSAKQRRWNVLDATSKRSSKRCEKRSARSSSMCAHNSRPNTSPCFLVGRPRRRELPARPRPARAVISACWRLARPRASTDRRPSAPRLLRIRAGARGMESHSPGPQYLYDQVKQQLRLETDRPIPVRQAILACRKGGTVSIIGVFAGLVDKFPLGGGHEQRLDDSQRATTRAALHPHVARAHGTGPTEDRARADPRPSARSGTAGLRDVQEQARRLRPCRVPPRGVAERDYAERSSDLVKRPRLRAAFRIRAARCPPP